MNTKCLQELYECLKVRYNNNLDYIRNNPNLDRNEVSEHYMLMKQIKEIELLLQKE